MSIPGSGSRRIFTDRLLALAQVQAGQSGTASLAALIAALPTAASVLATDVFPKLSSASVASKASGTQIRTYVLGISGGVANIPEDATVGSAPPAAPGSKIIVTEDGGSEISFIGHGAFSAGVRGIMASGTLASPTAISVAGVTHLAFLGGMGYDGTSWITTAKGLFSVRPAATWSATSHPTKLTLETTAVASTTRTSRWEVSSDGHLLGVTDDTYDIGASGATRPRRGYFGTELLAPLVTATTLAGTLATATQNSVTTMTSLTTIGTLVAGAVPASLVTAGTFGAGNYTVAGALTIDGAADVTYGVGKTLAYVDHDVTGPGSAVTRYGNVIDSRMVAGANFDVNIALYLGGTTMVPGAFTDTENYALVIATPTGGALNRAMSINGLSDFSDIGTSVLAVNASRSATTNLNLAAGTTGVSSLRVAHGVAPTSAVNGDLWGVSAESLYYRNNGVTQFASWTEQAAITDASGGVVIDAEARTALNDLLAKLRTINVIAA